MTAPASAPSMQALYTDHHGWLHGWLRKRIGCTHGAADLMQDTFVRILASRDALLAMREPRAYLAATAQRLLIDRARRAVIERAYLAELALVAEAQQGHPSPEQLLEAVQALEQIAAVLERVPPKPREAFLLRYLEGLTQVAVAERLGVSTRMVHKYLVQVLVLCDAEGA